MEDEIVFKRVGLVLGMILRRFIGLEERGSLFLFGVDINLTSIVLRTGLYLSPLLIKEVDG